MTSNDPFADYPHVRECLQILSQAENRFTTDCDAGRLLNDPNARIVIFFNALIRLWIDIEKAKNVGSGMDTIEAERKARRATGRGLRSIWGRRPLNLAERRAMIVGIAYRDDIRFSVSGERDTRMEAALQVAAVMEGLKSDDAIGTIRKSILRLRKQIRGQTFFRLDRTLLRVEAVDAETVMFADLPQRRGRPLKQLR